MDEQSEPPARGGQPDHSARIEPPGPSEQPEEPGQPSHRVVRGGDGRVRRVRMRRNEIGARKRRLFLDHLAATSNATEAARVAGAHIRSFYYLRRRDPDFAAQWDAALDQAGPRLTGKLVVWAETKGKRQAGAGAGRGRGENEPARADDLDGFDPDLALRILALHRQRPGERTGRRRGLKPRVATPQEVDEAVLKVLDKVAKRLARQGRCA